MVPTNPLGKKQSFRIHFLATKTREKRGLVECCRNSAQRFENLYWTSVSIESSATTDGNE